MADLSQSNNPHIPDADDHLSRLLVDQIEEPWYSSFVRNFKEFVNPPKLPPLELTSKPVPVKDIWGLYGRQNKSFMMSTGFQVAVVVVLFTALSNKTVQEKVKQTVSLVLPLDPLSPVAPQKKEVMKGGGGGGDRSPLPASKGRLPKAAVRQFVPPQAVINNTNAKMTMEPSILAPPDVNLPQVNMPNYGDPLGKIGPPSNGTGSGGGIGSGKGGGVGSGTGGGVGPGEGGGIGGGVYHIVTGASNPIAIVRPEPDYSDEARRARLQGQVGLDLIVDENGRPQGIRVV